MKEFSSYALFTILLGIYLVVPLKQPFLNSLHFVSHVYQHESPYHHHNHVFGGHGHHHSLIEKISHALEESADDHPLPVTIAGFEFQPVLPVQQERFPDVFPVLQHNIFFRLKTFLFPGPYFDVPTPPP